MIEKALESIKKEFDENCRRVEKEEYGEERVFLKGKGKGYFHSLAILESLEAEQPQLNENQQKWFDRLSSNYSWHENVIEHALYTTLTENDLPVLSRKEFSEVIISFADMVLKGEANDL